MHRNTRTNRDKVGQYELTRSGFYNKAIRFMVNKVYGNIRVE